MVPSHRTLAAHVWIFHPWRTPLHGDCRRLGAAVVSRVRALLLLRRRAVVHGVPVARVHHRTPLAARLADPSRPGTVRVRAAVRHACAGAVFQLAADENGEGPHATAAGRNAGLKPAPRCRVRIARSDRTRSTDEAP